MVAKTAKERMAAQRKRRKRLGLKRREFSLTDMENKLVIELLKDLRSRSK